MTPSKLSLSGPKSHRYYTRAERPAWVEDSSLLDEFISYRVKSFVALANGQMLYNLTAVIYECS
jgi:hypothetical protein